MGPLLVAAAAYFASFSRGRKQGRLTVRWGLIKRQKQFRLRDLAILQCSKHSTSMRSTPRRWLLDLLSHTDQW